MSQCNFCTKSFVSQTLIFWGFFPKSYVSSTLERYTGGSLRSNDHNTSLHRLGTYIPTGTVVEFFWSKTLHFNSHHADKKLIFFLFCSTRKRLHQAWHIKSAATQHWHRFSYLRPRQRTTLYERYIVCRTNKSRIFAGTMQSTFRQIGGGKRSN